MLEGLSVFLLIIFGLILILVELIFVPGTTLVGILGFIFTCFGIFLSFQNYGTTIGFVVMGISAFITAVAVYFSFKAGIYKKFALNSAIKSKVNDEYKYDLWVGDEGKTVSSLKPFGKAEFKDQVHEVSSNGNFIDAGQPVKIIRIKDNKIFVEPINIKN